MDSRGVVERYIPSLPCPLAPAPHPLVPASSLHPRPRPRVPIPVPILASPSMSSRPRPRVAVPSSSPPGRGHVGMGVVVAWTSRWLGGGSRSRWRGGGCHCRCRVQVVVDDVAWRGATSTWLRRGGGRRGGVVVEVAPSSLSSWCRCRHRVVVALDVALSSSS